MALRSGEGITAELAAALESQQPAGLDYYACGGSALCAAVEGFIDERGVPRSQFSYHTIQQAVES